MRENKETMDKIRKEEMSELMMCCACPGLGTVTKTPDANCCPTTGHCDQSHQWTHGHSPPARPTPPGEGKFRLQPSTAVLQDCSPTFFITF